MLTSKEYMINRYGRERYEAIVKITKIMNKTYGKDHTKYHIAKRVRAWVTPEGTKCYMPQTALQDPGTFIDQLVSKFRKECGGDIKDFRIQRYTRTLPFEFDNFTFIKVSKADDTKERIIRVAQLSIARN